MILNFAPDIDNRIRNLLESLNLPYIDYKYIFCFRSTGSSGRATARIWPLPHIWQLALKISPAYCIEVIAEKFDRMSHDDQERVLIHELMHIPKNFSGAVVPHRRKNRPTFRHYHQEVENLFRSLSAKKIK